MVVVVVALERVSELYNTMWGNWNLLHNMSLNFRVIPTQAITIHTSQFYDGVFIVILQFLYFSQK
jgi:hypothetical protein